MSVKHISNIFRRPIPQAGAATLNTQSPYDLSGFVKHGLVLVFDVIMLQAY